MLKITKDKSPCFTGHFKREKQSTEWLQTRENGTEYHGIYAICKERVRQIIQYAYLPTQRLIA
ncbi:hypothetical protein [Clostridium pasteurianum]|uniref:hypothetical protein n=1 Tax=Clostridium pasteurianum TaxID=1501 RepID=UPI00155A7F98|nr:hypothetical protein [Clostridium pasteurianum]